MINKTQTHKGLRFDILQNGHSKHQMGAITNLTIKDLRKIGLEIEDELFDIDLKGRTNASGKHPHFGRIQ